LLYCTVYTRNSSGDEIANVNFLTDDIVQALENTIGTIFVKFYLDVNGWPMGVKKLRK